MIDIDVHQMMIRPLAYGGNFGNQRCLLGRLEAIKLVVWYL